MRTPGSGLDSRSARQNGQRGLRRLVPLVPGATLGHSSPQREHVLRFLVPLDPLSPAGIPVSLMSLGSRGPAPPTLSYSLGVCF